MAGLKSWNPLSQELLIDVLVAQYGWVLALALVLGIRRTQGRAQWDHLPVLCWALIAARHHLDLLDTGCGMLNGPVVESFWISAYESLLALCCVCVVQVVGLSMAGRPAASLGTSGLRRWAMTGALLAVILDMFVFTWAVTPYPLYWILR